jgi:hypothetical protein
MLHDAEGRQYAAIIHGREAESGLWEGWIEFVELDGGARLLTSTETTQPDRKAVEYWASGLEPLYLEGAFSRAARATADKPAR